MIPAKAVKPETSLTEAQLDTLFAVRDLRREGMGLPPSLPELAGRLKKSISTARTSLLVLERKGYVVRARSSHRSITLTDKAKRVRRVRA